MTVPLSPEREQQIRAMKFTTGINAATGVFDTDVERELYRLAAENYNARLELHAELDRVRAELAVLRACDCFPNPSDHADRCPIFIAAFPDSGENW